MDDETREMLDLARGVALCIARESMSIADESAAARHCAQRVHDLTAEMRQQGFGLAVVDASAMFLMMQIARARGTTIPMLEDPAPTKRARKAAGDLIARLRG